MRQIQVDGETYVNINDISDWIVLHNEDIAHLEGPWPIVAKTLDDLAKSLREWAYKKTT